MQELVEQIDKVAQEAVEIAGCEGDENGDDKEVAYETMAEVLMLKKNWPRAIDWWNKALAIHSAKDAYYGRLLGHLAESLWDQGDQQGALKKVKEAVAIIKQNDERQISSDHDYRWRVWLTGTLMKELMILSQLKMREGAMQIQQELELNLEDKRLGHRRRQYQDLKKELGI